MAITIRQALEEASSFLRSRGVPSARLEAELLLSFLLKRDRAYLYAHSDEKLPAELREAYAGLLERRAARVPLAYITGYKEFMGFPFKVQEEVLIPRPETEHLVEAVLEWVEERYPYAAHEEGAGLNFLDLGTGCGCIAVSLAHYLPRSRVTAVDRDENAVRLAAENARQIGVFERLDLHCGSYCSMLSPQGHRFQAVLSNPPYVESRQLHLLPPEVHKEPLSALDGGADGLDAYRQIFKEAPALIASPGLLAVETGAGMAGKVVSLGRGGGLAGSVTVKKDYAGIDRVVMFEL